MSDNYGMHARKFQSEVLQAGAYKRQTRITHSLIRPPNFFSYFMINTTLISVVAGWIFMEKPYEQKAGLLSDWTTNFSSSRIPATSCEIGRPPESICLNNQSYTLPPQSLPAVAPILVIPAILL